MLYVDATPRKHSRQLVLQDLHVARQNQEIGFGLPDQFPDRSLLRVLGLLRHRQAVKWDLTEFEIAVGLARMIRDNSGWDHFEFAGPPAIQDIGETVIRFRNQQHYPTAGRAVSLLPAHS